MIATSFRTRGVVFAYLIGPPRPLGRHEGMDVHSAVCEALGVDDLTFRFSPVPPQAAQGAPGSSSTTERSRGFSIQMERRLGRGLFKITIDNPSIDQPVRFLLEYTFPPTREHIYQDLDAAAEAAFGALGPDWQRALAEARIRGQLEAQGGSGVTYLAQRVLHLDDQKAASLEAPPAFLGIVLETPSGDPTADDPLHQPKREIKVEVLREDPRCVYVEVMSQWPQLSIAPGGTIDIDARRIRSFDKPPSAYLENTMDFITDSVLPLFTVTGA